MTTPKTLPPLQRESTASIATEDGIPGVNLNSVRGTEQMLSALKFADYSPDLSYILVMLYGDLDEMIRNADLKAQIVLGVNTIVAATLLNIPNMSLRAIYAGEAHIIVYLQLFAMMVMVLALVASTLLALQVTIPKFHASKSDNLFYFRNIRGQKMEEYRRAFFAESIQGIKEDVIEQIHAKANIVERKYHGVRISMEFLMAAVIAWGVLRILIVFNIG
jgi:hypothetical protein